MSYAYAQSAEQAPAQEAPTQEAPAPAGPGNAAQCEEGGLMGGLAAKAMDLTGPMAGMILECMPLGKAMEMAGPLLSNPTIAEWAKRIDIGAAIDELGAAASEKLLALWPVGTGVDAEGELAGQIVGGISILGKVKAIRTGTKEIQVDAELYEGLDTTVGGGAELTNAFDDVVAGAIVEAGLSIGLSSQNHLTANLDILQVLRSAADLKAINVLQILQGALPAQGVLDTGMDPRGLLQNLVNELEGMQWTTEDAIELGAGGRASAGIATADDLGWYFPTAVAVLGTVIQGLAPLLQASAGCVMRILPAGFPMVKVEHIGQIDGLARLLTGHPDLGGILDEQTIAALSGPVSAGIGFTLRYDCFMAPFITSVDLATAFLTLTGTSEVGGLSVIDGVEIPLSEIPQYLMAGGDLDEILAAGAAPTLTRSVGIDVPIAQLEQIFPSWIQQILPEGTMGMDSEQVLRLEGSATLPGEALMCLQGRGIQLPAMGLAVLGLTDIAAAAIGLSMGHGRGAVPEWLAGHEDALSTMGAQVQMSEARLVGHIHIGAGGGLSGNAAGKLATEARAEGGLAVDKAVEGAQARQVLAALSGQQAA
jgi:hypothetical protein